MYYDKKFIGQPMILAERLSVPRLQSCFARKPHIGIHCHVFQGETFLNRILKPVLFMELACFDIVDFHPAKDNYGEFMVVLRKQRPRISMEVSDFYVRDYVLPADNTSSGSQTVAEEKPPVEPVEPPVPLTGLPLSESPSAGDGELDQGLPVVAELDFIKSSRFWRAFLWAKQMAPYRLIARHVYGPEWRSYLEEAVDPREELRRVKASRGCRTIQFIKKTPMYKLWARWMYTSTRR